MGLLDRLTSGRRADHGNREVGRVLFTAQRPPLMDVVAVPPPVPAAPTPAADAGATVGGTLDGMLVDQRGEPRSIIDMHERDDARQDAADLLSAMAAPPPPPAPEPAVAPPPPRPAPGVEWTQPEHDEPALFEAPADEPVAAEPEQDLLDQFAGLLDGFDEPVPPRDDAAGAA